MGQSQLDARSACKHCQTSDHRLVVMVMLLMMVMLTIRTGRCATHSTAWFPRVSATGLAQRHTPPKVACELAYFLWQWHRLIEIGQELTKDISSCHLLCSPHHFSSIVSLSYGVAIASVKALSQGCVRFHLHELETTTSLHPGHGTGSPWRYRAHRPRAGHLYGREAVWRDCAARRAPRESRQKSLLLLC